MSNRWLRFGIAFLAIAAASAAGYRIYQQEQRLAADLVVSRGVDSAAESAIVTISELKAALHAYIADGQGDAFWTARAATLIDRLRSALLELDPPATTAGAPLTEALDLTDRVAAAEKRARDHVRNGERLLAGEVIFTECRDLLDAMRLQIVRGRTAAGEAAIQNQAATRREVSALSLGAAGILAFAALLLVIPGAATLLTPAPEGKMLPPQADEFESSARVIARTLATPDPAKQQVASGSGRSTPAIPPSTLGARNTMHPPAATARPASRSSGSVTPAGASTPAASTTSGAAGAQRKSGVTAPGAPTIPVAHEVRTISLRDAAAVCTDLGRVSQSVEIAGLLERAANVLSANGVIVWLASPDRSEMYPAASAGYDDRLLARIGSIPRDAANVTAAAFRDASGRLSPRQGTSAAALAVPLMTPLGPVGVFSAEIRDVATIDESRLAVATIFAAQLAMLLGSMAEPEAGTESTGESIPPIKAQA